VYCGQVYRGLCGGPGNPFTAGAASTVGIFGHDNTTPGLVAPHVIAQASGGGYAPFDRVIVHGMLTFEGQKCSTSKRHGLWLHELFTGTSISSDELRFVLAHADLDQGPADITLHGLAETVAAYRLWHANTLPAAAAHAPAAPGPDSSPLLRLVEEQHAHLDPGRLDLPAATRILHTWMWNADRPAADWLLGLALLGEPIIPDLARHAWTQLGHTGTPTLHAAATARPAPLTTNQIPPPPAEPLTSTQLRPLAQTAPPAGHAS
jgi:methionyl-tRNA synthetase